MTGEPARRAAHAERPRRPRRWAFAVAAVVVLGGTVTALHRCTPDPVPSIPTSARNITAPARP